MKFEKHAFSNSLRNKDAQMRKNVCLSTVRVDQGISQN